MFYEEKWINDLLFWRATPDGEWRPVSAPVLCTRLLETERQLDVERRALAAANERADTAKRWEAEANSLGERVTELDEALRDAIEEVEHWSGYANEYLRDKHHLAGNLAKLRAALQPSESQVKP